MSENADTIRRRTDAFNAFMRGELSIEAGVGCAQHVVGLAVTRQRDETNRLADRAGADPAGDFVAVESR